jgi:uncharacterized protein YecE (DUF72 family)
VPLPENFYLGTSSWSAESWVGSFYPTGTPPAEFLEHYAGRFRTVEVDATWYRTPSPRMVDGWRERTPEGFVFAAKIPQVVTHEKLLDDCRDDLDKFLTVMRRLGPRLGPLLFQFPYFRKSGSLSPAEFLKRLEALLPHLPDDIRFAVEVRNKGWLRPDLFDLLRSRGIALAWVDHPYLPGAREWARLPGARTTDWLYVRWLGDRYKIEETTTAWNRLVVDRSRETDTWSDVLYDLTPRLGRVYAYYNNHYAGCAYQSADLFEEAWDRRQKIGE